MAQKKQPAAIHKAKGNPSHLSKAEFERMEAQEVKCFDTKIIPPEILDGDQVDQFNYYAGLLKNLGVWTELDAPIMAQFVMLGDAHAALTKAIEKALSEADLDKSGELIRQQERIFKQAHTCASSLCMTVSDRCKLVVPSGQSEEFPDL